MAKKARSAAQKAATRKLVAWTKAHKKGGKKKSGKKSSSKKSVTKYRPRPSTSMSLFHNPPQASLIDRFIPTVFGSLIGGVSVVTGKAITRAVSSNFSFADGSVADALVELITAMTLGVVTGFVLPEEIAMFLAAGGVASPIETLIASLNIKGLSPLLGNTPTDVVMLPADAAKLRARLAGISGGGGINQARNALAGLSTNGSGLSVARRVAVIN